MSFQPEAVRAFEHAGWQRAASSYGNSFAYATAPFVAPLLEAAEISPGQHVLDVACGPGYLAAAAAGRGATAHGLDFSAEMVGIARNIHPDIVVTRGTQRTCRIPTAHFMRSYQASESITFLSRNWRLPSASACSNRVRAWPSRYGPHLRRTSPGHSCSTRSPGTAIVLLHRLRRQER